MAGNPRGVLWDLSGVLVSQTLDGLALLASCGRLTWWLARDLGGGGLPKARGCVGRCALSRGAGT